MTAPILATPRSGWGGRGYRIPGRPDVYPSVTTILKAISKGDGLLQWVADQTAAKAVVSLPYLMTVSDEVAWRSLRFYWSNTPDLVGSDVRRYWEGVRDDSAELGTNIHEYVEADIDGLMPHPEPSSIEAEEMIDAWAEFFANHEIVPHRQEFTCVNDRTGFAGTADADWTITCLHEKSWNEGRKRHEFCLDPDSPGPYRTLVDLKTARHTWDEHGFQLGALASCNSIMRQVTADAEGAMKAMKTEKGRKIVSYWVEDEPPAWERFALLHIRPDDLDSKGNEVARFCELKDRTEDMDLYQSGFEGGFAVAKSQHLLKARAKARGIETEEH